MIGVIGMGKLGSSLAASLAASGAEVTGIDRSEKMNEFIDPCDLLFLALPDDAIEEFAQGHLWRGKKIVHCSGALGLEVLEKARQDGALVGSFHPMQAFRGPKTSWQGIAVNVSAEAPLEAELFFLAEALGALPQAVRAEQKIFVHLAASLLSNFSFTLFEKAKKVFAKAGFSSEEAERALRPLLQGTIDNSSLTGPIARGDVGTIRKHLDCLRESFPEEVDFYRCLSEATLLLTKEDLPTTRAEEIAALLRGEEIFCERC
ncbi:MAG TPA: Rossmann-like and DUF2520 domain-containing protein [Chroococcales cyanobacterium]